jgi:hypothetical protein
MAWPRYDLWMSDGSSTRRILRPETASSTFAVSGPQLQEGAGRLPHRAGHRASTRVLMALGLAISRCIWAGVEAEPHLPDR